MPPGPYTINALRLKNLMAELDRTCYGDALELSASYRVFDPPVPFAEKDADGYRPVEQGAAWGRNFDVAWFHLQGTVPAAWEGRTVAARINFGGEACLFDDAGTPVESLTSTSVYFPEWVRDRLVLYHPCQGGEQVSLWFEVTAAKINGLDMNRDAGADDPDRRGAYAACVKDRCLAVFRVETWHTLLDLRTLFHQMEALPEASVRRARIMHVLMQAESAYRRSGGYAEACRAVLQPLLAERAGASDLATTAVGHAHLDTAWLWPLSETVRKCARTFSRQVANLERYPAYVFGASQAQHYDFTRKHYPGLYEKIKQKVAEGRWEVQGCMWVEADCNLSGGEALVRQVLFGKRFFQREFGIDVRNLWLPDVFGYTAALPQILKQSGVDYMLTQKLSWNQYNRFPHHTFHWEGLDGSRVLVHFPPEDTYNSVLNPGRLMFARENFVEKDRLPEFLTLFGLGDGGGGPSEDIIEMGRRQQDLEGCPRTTFGTARDFFDRLAHRDADLSVWRGELYLERHQGTLTSQAHAKRMNRRLEHRLRGLEILFSGLPLEDYPQQELNDIWQGVLLLQFHDILPGSSIHRVYAETRETYGALDQRCDRLEETTRSAFREAKDRLVAVNTLSTVYDRPIKLPSEWTGHEVLDADGTVLPVQTEVRSQTVLAPVPALRAKVLRKGRRIGEADRPAGADPRVMENDLVRYAFSDEGLLTSAFDKELQREMIAPGGTGNALLLFNDTNGWRMDAWDMDLHYQDQLIEQASCRSIEHLCSGPVREGRTLTFAVGDSAIVQEVYLTAGTRRLDFVTRVDWQERRRMLRVRFAVNVRAETAAYDAQFGFVRRPTHCNTSWEQASHEVCCHRYIDLSESGFGAALLNDGKYGARVQENRMELNLLRGPCYPDPEADLGAHAFAYAFLPHPGDLTNATVVHEAAQLNQPLLVFDGCDGAWQAPLRAGDDRIVIETVKKAEDEPALLVRLYENRGSEGRCRVTFTAPVEAVWATNLMEEDAEELAAGENGLDLAFSPFEIKTLKLRMDRTSGPR